jgi:hypothetical protein
MKKEKENIGCIGMPDIVMPMSEQIELVLKQPSIKELPLPKESRLERRKRDRNK